MMRYMLYPPLGPHSESRPCPEMVGVEDEVYVSGGVGSRRCAAANGAHKVIGSRGAFRQDVVQSLGQLGASSMCRG
jgi:hypothetical protein